jgi:hypothetical protein
MIPPPNLQLSSWVLFIYPIYYKRYSTIFFASHDLNCRYENSPKMCPALRVNKSFVTSCLLRSFGLACDTGKCSVCEKRLLLNRNVLRVTGDACCISKIASTLYKDNVGAQGWLFTYNSNSMRRFFGSRYIRYHLWKESLRRFPRKVPKHSPAHKNIATDNGIQTCSVF